MNSSMWFILKFIFSTGYDQFHTRLGKKSPFGKITTASFRDSHTLNQNEIFFPFPEKFLQNTWKA